MNMTRDRVQSLAWALIITVSFALLLALTFRVNAVKSEVRLMDRKILAVKRDRMLLETEFQTRSNQMQLAAVNAVELGLEAPKAGQYIDGEPQLASLSKPAAPDAPAPILMASAQVPVGPKPGPVAGTAGMLPAVMTTVAHKSLGEATATRMLAQHGEKVAPGGKERLERTLALANAKTTPVLAGAKPGPIPLGRQKHALAAAPAGPAAASADFLAAATGNERLRSAQVGTSTRSTTALAASKPSKKGASVADAFGSDWVKQMSAKPRNAPESILPAKAKPSHRRVALQDGEQASNQ